MTLHHKNEIYNLPQGCSLLKVKNIPWLVKHRDIFYFLRNGQMSKRLSIT